MKEGHFRPKSITANLLMSTKRHLPCRKSNKKNSICSHKITNMTNKGILIGNMLNDIVQNNNVKLFLISRKSIILMLDDNY